MNRPLKDLHDEDLRELAEEGSREDLHNAVREAVARDDERKEK